MADSGEVPVEEEKAVTVVKNATDLQRLKLEKLMKNPEKLAFIPERPKDKKFSDPAEFVRNVMGSSAGAGSGEFHVYRHIRRREYSRQEFLNESKEKDQLDRAYHEKIKQNRQDVEDKASKKRSKRQRRKEKVKAKRQKMKELKKKGITEDKSSSSSSEEEESEDEDEKSSEKEKDNSDNEVESKEKKEIKEKNSVRENTEDNEPKKTLHKNPKLQEISSILEKERLNKEIN